MGSLEIQDYKGLGKRPSGRRVGDLMNQEGVFRHH
jgi:hypothetical protein